MRRRALAPISLLIVAAVALSACGGASRPDLTDPSEIITKSVEAIQKAKTVHLSTTVEGSISSSLTGTGTGSMQLAGTTLSADLDLANSNAHLSASVPALLGLTADIILVGTDTYSKVSLTGDKYTKATSAPGTITDPATVITEIKAFLAKPELKPTKKDDAACGSKKCYQVVIDLTADELSSLIPGQPIGDATVMVTMLFDKDTLYPASGTAVVKGTQIGDLTLKLTLSEWDKAVTIKAPPADQVGP